MMIMIHDNVLRRNNIFEEGMGNFTLQLETAIIFEIVCNPLGSSPAKTGFAGCADIVTLTLVTHGSAATTSFACCSNWQEVKMA